MHLSTVRYLLLINSLQFENIPVLHHSSRLLQDSKGQPPILSVQFSRQRSKFLLIGSIPSTHPPTHTKPQAQHRNSGGENDFRETQEHALCRACPLILIGYYFQPNLTQSFSNPRENFGFKFSIPSYSLLQIRGHYGSQSWLNR